MIFSSDLRRYEICISSPPKVYVRDGIKITVWGSVYDEIFIDEFLDLDIDQIFQHAILWSGYFFVILEVNDDIYLFNDIFGNFRLYTKEEDDVLKIFDEVPSVECSALDLNELQYFKNHKYTTGFGTYIDGLGKLPPATLIKKTLKNTNLQSSIYFEMLGSLNKDYSSYEDITEESLKNTLDNMDQSLPTYLFFSGGIDSSLLHFITKKKIEKFKLVFVKYIPSDLDNHRDELMVDWFSKKYDIEVIKIKFSSEQVDDKKNIEMFLATPFDLAYPAIPYALNWLYEEFGPCNVISGQSSDSIFCWGSSSESISAGLQRFITSHLYVRLPKLIRYVISQLYTIIYQKIWGFSKSWYVPYDTHEFYRGILDPQGYLPIVRGNREFKSFLSNITNIINNNIISEKFRIMYYKLMYLQGTSNILWIKHCSINSHNLFMPFLSPEIVGVVISRQSKLKSILRPRYELKSILSKDFNIKAFLKFKSNLSGTKASPEKFDHFYSKYVDYWNRRIEQEHDK